MSGSSDAGRLLVRIEATTAQLRQQLQAAETQVAGTSAKIDQQLKKADQAFDRMNAASKSAQDAVAGLSARLGPMGSMLGSLGAAGIAAGAGIAALGVGLTAVARAGDVATGVLARLTSATGSAAQAQQVYERLFALSQQTGIAVAESAGSFARFAVAAKEIGGTNDQVLKLVEGIQKAGIVAGSSAQETGAAVQQLGQALASGTLQGDELRSLLENMPQLAQALARELGVGIGQLRQMGSEGRLTADVVFPALLRASEKIGVEFEKMPPTMGRAFGILGEGMARFAADLDRALGLSQAIARAVQAAASAVDGVRRAALPTEQEQITSTRDAALARVRELETQLAGAGDIRALGIGQLAGPNDRTLNVERIQADLAAARSAVIQHNDRLAEIEREGQETRFGEYVTAQNKAAETARQSADRAYKAEREKWDKDYKLREDHRKRVELIDKAEATGAISSMEATRDRARANEDLREGLEKTAGTVGKVAEAHAKVGKAAQDADQHVEAFYKHQDKLAKEAVKAQEEAADAVRRFQERSFDAVLNVGERAFDRLGDSLVDAFVSGEGAAVNFGGVLRGVIASALADIAKLAVINPLLNSVFTSSSGPRPTLAGAFGGSATSFGGIGDVLGLGNLLGGESIGSMLGLTGTGGLLGATAITGWGTSTSAALGAMGGAYGPASLAQLQAFGGGGLLGGAGASFGSLLGGAGAGFGAGMFLNQMLGGNQTSGMIGSGLGSAAGAIIGSIIPGIGTLIGGLIGGAAGGGLGGLIGPGESVRGYGFRLQSSGRGPDNTDINEMGDRLLPIDRRYYNEEGAAAFQQADALVAGVNAYLAANGLQVGGVSIIEGNKNSAASLGQGFAQLRFGSDEDTRLNSFLTGQTFDDPAKLQVAVDGFKAAAAAIDALGAESVPAFTASLKAVNDNFAAGVEQARKYGLAEDSLTTARAKALASLEAARTETLRQADVSLSIRRLTAAGNTQQAELARQAEAAGLELKAFGEALDALALPAEQRAAGLLALEETQAAERLAIIERYGEQAAAALRQRTDAVTGVVGSLADFARGLWVANDNPLNPTARLDLATSQFDVDLDAARSGDFQALSRIQSSASTLLNVSRDVYGTGQGFAATFGRVLDGIGSVGNLGPDRLTASALTAETRGQTEALVDALARLQGEVAALRREVQQGSANPLAARAA